MIRVTRCYKNDLCCLSHPVQILVKAEASLSAGSSTEIKLSGSVSQFSLSAIDFSGFNLNASMTIGGGITLIKYLKFSGGVSNSPIGSGTASFNYIDNQPISFSLIANPTLPEPFDQVMYEA